MLIELILLFMLGITFIYVGYLIWKKEKISLIHSYHYTKVKEQDKKLYTKMMGKGVLMIGIGMILTGIIDYITKTAYGWFAFAFFFILGFATIVEAQKKYNGGVF